jgi:hypothetical protein
MDEGSMTAAFFFWGEPGGSIPLATFLFVPLELSTLPDCWEKKDISMLDDMQLSQRCADRRNEAIEREATYHGGKNQVPLTPSLRGVDYPGLWATRRIRKIRKEGRKRQRKRRMTK